MTGSPSPSLEAAEGERGTQKVILGVNVFWTSLDASGQSIHAAEQYRVIISGKLIARQQQDKTIISYCHIITALMAYILFILLSG